MYYRGNISNVELSCLDGNNWLNDVVINRYLEMISKTPFLAVSSFYIESFIKPTGKGPEKLPGKKFLKLDPLKIFSKLHLLKFI